MSYLGIDLGTSSVKVVIADASGTVLGEASVSYPTHHPTPGAAEQDPRNWWKATVEAICALDVQAGSITAIGMTGQMHGLVCLNAADEVIRPAIIWADTRGATTAREITSRIGDARLADLVGSALASGFLGDQRGLAATTRAPQLAIDCDSAAPQGLHSFSAHRREGDRPQRCRQHGTP